MLSNIHSDLLIFSLCDRSLVPESSTIRHQELFTLLHATLSLSTFTSTKNKDPDALPTRATAQIHPYVSEFDVWSLVSHATIVIDEAGLVPFVCRIDTYFGLSIET